MSLNSKKSWHPGKALNRAKVAKLEEDQKKSAEQAALKLQEVNEERVLAQFKKVAQGNSKGGKESRSSMLEWMYKAESPSILAFNSAKSSKGAESGNPRNQSSDTYLGLLQQKEDQSSPLFESKEGEFNKLKARKAAIDPLVQILSRSKAKKPQNGIRKTDTRQRK